MVKMEQPSLKTKETGKAGAVRPRKGAALFLCAMLAVEGLAGCKRAPEYSQKHVDCYDNVCGPLRLDKGESIRLRLPDNSEVIVEPGAEACVKVTAPLGKEVEVAKDTKLRPEIVRAMDERGR